MQTIHAGACMYSRVQRVISWWKKYSHIGLLLSYLRFLGAVRPTTWLRGILDRNAGSRCSVELLVRGLNDSSLFFSLKMVFVILLSHACISTFLVSAFCIVSPPAVVPYYLYVVHARESAATGATLQVLALLLEQGEPHQCFRTQ